MLLPGAHSVAYAYPDVTIVAGALDEAIDTQYRIRPGLGNFGEGLSDLSGYVIR